MTPDNIIRPEFRSQLRLVRLSIEPFKEAFIAARMTDEWKTEDLLKEFLSITRTMIIERKWREREQDDRG